MSELPDDMLDMLVYFYDSTTEETEPRSEWFKVLSSCLVFFSDAERDGRPVSTQLIARFLRSITQGRPAFTPEDLGRMNRRKLHLLMRSRGFKWWEPWVMRKSSLITVLAR